MDSCPQKSSPHGNAWRLLSVSSGGTQQSGAILVSEIQFSNFLSERQNCPGINRQFINLAAKQGFRKLRHCPQLPADSHRDSVAVSGFYRHADLTKQDRVTRISMGIKIAVHCRSSPIHRKGILQKVIGSDGKKSQFPASSSAISTAAGVSIIIPSV